MTEQEWLDANDPEPMLEFLRAVSARKLRLFAVACLRRVSGLFPNAAIREAIEVGERDADGLASKEDLRRAQKAVVEWSGSTMTTGRATQGTAAESSAVQAAFWLTYDRPLLPDTLARETARY